MTSPKISVIIPVYNAEDYLKQCLDSVLNQSLREIEVICVDDGSTDGSLTILQEYALRDSRVKVFHQYNQHAGVARNKGIDVATGEYIHFLDADDYILDYSYEAIYNKATGYNLDVLKCRSIGFDVLQNMTIYNNWYMFKGVQSKYYYSLLTLEEGSPVYSIAVVPWNGIYKRSFIIEHDIRFTSLYCVNDRSFYDKVITNAKRMMISRDWLVVHRVNQEKSLVQKRAEYFDCHFQSIKIINNHLIGDKISLEISCRILKAEFLDLIFWYKKFCNDMKYGEKIRQTTKEFVKEYNGLCSDLLNEIYNEVDKEVNEKNIVISSPRYFKIFYSDVYTKPLISLILFVERDQENLYGCLDSIRDQTLEKIEIICVYNVSNYDLRIILQEYANIDRRIRIIEQAKLDISMILKIAKGEFLLFLNSNDFLEKLLCEKMYREVKKQNVDIVLFKTKVYDTSIEDYIDEFVASGAKLFARRKTFLQMDNSTMYFSFTYADRLKNVEQQLHTSVLKEVLLKNSVSFRIGRIITWAPRKIKGCINCFRQHGVIYTVKRFFWHITHDVFKRNN